jgi:hypothetical protein
MYADLLCGCDTMSYKICLATAQIAIPLFWTVAQKCSNKGYLIDNHAFIYVDMKIDPSVGQAIVCTKVILINNKEFPADCNICVSLLVLFTFFLTT